MAELWQDLRHAIRLLRRSLGLTLVALLTLGLGIGASTATFTVVNAVLLKPLPYKAPEQLVEVWERDPDQPYFEPPTVSHYRELKRQANVFEGMAPYAITGFVLTGVGEAQDVPAAAVSSSFFPLLGVEAALGRTFLRRGGEDTEHPRTVVLGHGLWMRSFGGDPDVVGKTIRLNDQAYEVVGVLPRTFRFPYADLRVFTPLELHERRGDDEWVSVLARTKANVSLEQAQAGMKVATQHLRRQFPEMEGREIVLASLREQLVRDRRPSLLVLFGAVLFVLLLACVNVASLLLSRTVHREQELAVRAALGAGRGRLVRQLLTESVVLSLLGGALGLLVGFWVLRILIAVGPAELTAVHRMDDLTLDRTVVGFALGISLLTGLLTGLFPVVKTSRSELTESLNRAAATSAREVRRALGCLVVAEVGLAVLTLTGAGLMMRSFLLLQSVDPGINTSNLLTMRLALPFHLYAEPNQQRGVYEQLLERLRALPGVESAAAISGAPLEGFAQASSIAPGKQKPLDPRGWKRARTASCSAEYFKTAGIPLLRGRTFTSDDTGNSPPVALISETMARRYWTGEDPVGRYLVSLRDTFSSPDAAPRRIVGVVADVRYASLNREVDPHVYIPLQQGVFSWTSFVIRTRSDPSGLISLVKSQVQAVDPNIPVESIAPMEQSFAQWLATPRFHLFLFTVFGIAAVVIAAAGIFGVFSYSVNRRRQEMAIRLAMGAQPTHILRMVLGQGMALALLGIALGLFASLALTRFLASLLFSISPTDSVTFAGVSLLFVAVALLACYLPARRAMRVDPMVALRYE